MNKEEEFIFRQVVASSRLESMALSENTIELLRKVIEKEMTVDEALNYLKQRKVIPDGDGC